MDINVLELLERSAARVPDKVAFEDRDESFTYSQFVARAKEIGSFLIKKVGKTNMPVPVLIERNALSILTFFSIVYSGNFYVPVDVSMPEERMLHILNSVDAKMVLNASKAKPADFLAENGMEVVEVPEIPHETNEEGLKAVREHAVDTDPLYCLFTSGSTGVPKGVLVAHRSVLDLAAEFVLSFGLDENCIFGNQAPYDFDGSNKDLYNSIAVGATVVVIPKEYFVMPKKLIEFMNEYKIDTMFWVVSSLRIVADFKVLDKLKLDHPLRFVMFSGEVMPPKDLNYWMANAPEAKYVNLYGPTEITCNCTYFEVLDRELPLDRPIPMGKPFRNTRVFLVDAEDNEITEPGKIGELLVEGSSLALGYWNNKEQTDKAFTFRKSVTQYPCRVYRTGDLAYYLDDGSLMYKSRRDHQIHHMGHRIELGEIEMAINSLPFITINCCVYNQVRNKIVCYYQGDATKKEIVMALTRKLPKYMWPNIYNQMDALPLNGHGKIDRKKLESMLNE